MAKRLFEYIKYYYQVPVSFYIEDRWMVDEIDEGIKEENKITGLIPELLDLTNVQKRLCYGKWCQRCFGKYSNTYTF